MTSTGDQVVVTKLESEFFHAEEGADEKAAAESVEEGTEVAKGNHVVPDGVAVEELKNYGGHKDLKNECPTAVRDLLTSKDVWDVYDKFVQSIFDDTTTRAVLIGKWRDAQFVSVLDHFRDDFTAKGIKVALCKRSSGSGTNRWLEFIDVEAVGDYVPQYDIANFSGQIIKTVYHKLKFPNGVAVEELKNWGGRKKLKETIPIYVEKILEKKGLMEEYNQMIDHVIEAGAGANTKIWNTEKLKAIMDVHKPMFESKGVEVFVSHKQEWVSHGNGAGHFVHFRWIEFVDREEQPTYSPQRDAEYKDEKCSIM